MPALNKLTISGAILAAIAILIYELPDIIYKASVATAGNVCNSSLGQLGQAFSVKARSACGTASAISVGCHLVFVAGVVLAGFGLWRAYHPRPVTGTAVFSVTDRRNPCYQADTCVTSPQCESYQHCRHVELKT